MEDGYLEGVPREVGTSDISEGQLMFFLRVRIETHS